MRLRFVPVRTTPLLQLESASGETSETVKGAIVKVAPLLRERERATFDGAGVANRLRQAGALAVQLSPVPIPDDGGAAAKRRVVVGQSPEDVIRDFFGEMVGVPEGERAEAEALSLELAGLSRGR